MSKIRLLNESDAEYQRRQGGVSLLSGAFYSREIAKLVQNNNLFLWHRRLAELRESCGVRPGRDETFKWDVWKDVDAKD
jgi:hypothetical protein